MEQMYSTGELSRLLSIPAYKIEYAHTTGRLAEPAYRFIGKRVYCDADVLRVARHFGVTPRGDVKDVDARKEDA